MPELEAADEANGRAFWSGTLSFGLVSIPVDLLPAHHSTRVGLHMVDESGTRLARRYYCSADGEPVDAEHIVRGYELDSGKLVTVTDEELEALAPTKSREIDLRLFVDRHSIDPLYFERSYFLAPGANSGKAYRLLGIVMERTQRAGIATFVMRDKEYLIAIFADGGLLRAETLRFADEVRSISKLGLPKPTELDASAIKRMQRAVSARTEKARDPAELSDPHEAVRELAERKHARQQDVIASHGEPAGAPGKDVVDLFEVLRQSLAQNDLASRGRAPGAPARAKGRATKRASRASKARPPAPARAPSKATAHRKKKAG